MRALQIKRSNPRYGERWIDGFTQSSAGGAIFFHTEKWASGIIVSESTQKHKNRKKKTSRSMEDNKIRCVALFSIAESACAKYPVMPVSINFANKNFKSKMLVRLTHLRTRDTLSPAFCASLWDWGTLRVLVFLCIINYVSHQFRDHCEQSIQADWVLNEKEKISCLWDLKLATTSADFRC